MKKFIRFLTIKTWTMLGLLLAGIGGSVLLIATAPANAPTPKAEKTWSVSTLRAKPATLSPNLLVFGRVETPKTAILTAAVITDVSEVPVREGQHVEKGDLLVALDDRIAQLEVSRREADVQDAVARISMAKAQHKADREVLAHQEKLYALSQEKLARHESLQQKRQVSEAVLDEVRRESGQQAIVLAQQKNKVEDFRNQLATLQAQKIRSEAALEEARINLSHTQITAPFNGRIVQLRVAPGERVLAGFPLIELYDVDALEVRATVPSEHIATLRDGLNGNQQVTAQTTLSGETLTFELARLAGKVNAGSSGVDALFRLSAGSQSLEIGRALDLKITLPAQPNLVAIPVQSIYGNQRIYKVQDDRLSGFDVERVGEYLDAEGEYNVLVRSDQITADDLIVTTQLPKAIDGLKVNVVN